MANPFDNFKRSHRIAQLFKARGYGSLKQTSPFSNVEITKAKAGSKRFEEGFTAEDLISLEVRFAFFDEVLITDDEPFVSNYRDEGIPEPVSVSDLIKLDLTYVRNFYDNAYVYDSIGFVGRDGDLTESILFEERLSFYQNKFLTDVSKVSETLRLIATFDRDLFEDIIVDEDIILRFDAYRTFEDIQEIGEVLSLQPRKSFTDAFYTSDILRVQTEKGLAQIITTSDTWRVRLNKTFADAVSLSDHIEFPGAESVSTLFSDPSTVSDIVKLTWGYSRKFYETVTAVDVYQGDILPKQPLTPETITINETYNLVIEKQLSDVSTATDFGEFTMQNYFSEDYISGSYLGTVATF
jgi:hypothetical protein